MLYCTSYSKHSQTSPTCLGPGPRWWFIDICVSSVCATWQTIVSWPPPPARHSGFLKYISYNLQLTHRVSRLQSCDTPGLQTAALPWPDIETADWEENDLPALRRQWQWRSCSVSGHIWDVLISPLLERQIDFYRMNKLGHHKKGGMRCDVVVSLFDDMQFLFFK